jgi:hypothetical protein
MNSDKRGNALRTLRIVLKQALAVGVPIDKLLATVRATVSKMPGAPDRETITEQITKGTVSENGKAG